MFFINCYNFHIYYKSSFLFCLFIAIIIFTIYWCRKYAQTNVEQLHCQRRKFHNNIIDVKKLHVYYTMYTHKKFKNRIFHDYLFYRNYLTDYIIIVLPSMSKNE